MLSGLSKIHVSKPCIHVCRVVHMRRLMGLPNPIFLANLFSTIETSKLFICSFNVAGIGDRAT